MNKKRIILGIALSGFSIIVFLYYFNIKITIDLIRNFNFRLIVLLLLISITGILLRAFRWKIIIRQNDSVSFKEVLFGLGLGYMVNNLFPVKIGELVRILYINRRSNCRKSFLLGTVVIERFIDIIIIIIILATSVIFSKTLQKILNHNKQLLFIIFLVVMSGFFLMFKVKYLDYALQLVPSRFSGKIKELIKSFSSAMNFIKNRKVLFYVTVLSGVIWLITCIMSFTIIKGLGIVVPFYAILFIVSAGIFGMIIPSTSGSIGVYHGVTTSALMLFGITREVALSYAIISHALDFIPNVLFGLFIVAQENFSFKEITEGVKRIDDIEII
jgi:glycosyltransferase 2 family protein